MLRVEVLREWGSFKDKLATVRLTPQDKEAYEFISEGKIGMFSYHAVDSRTSLEQLEKEIKTEWEKYPDLNTENEMLSCYWLCWTSFGNLILNWIDLKRIISFYNEVSSKIINWKEVTYQLNEPTTFYAVVQNGG